MSEGNSYITCFYFHFQTTRQLNIDNTKVKKTLPAGTNFIVMANCICSGADKVKDMYDLKGVLTIKRKCKTGLRYQKCTKDAGVCILLLAQI